MMVRLSSLRKAWPQVLIALLMLGADAPALASDGFAIPDPSALTLLGLGVLGLIIGRSSGKRPPKD
jgi:VIT1/CCC1 family predicted Fe2+/Mn2+ transporter